MATAAKISIQLEAQTATLKKGFDDAKGAINKLDAGMSNSVAMGMAKFNAGMLAVKAALGAVSGAVNTLLTSMLEMDEMQKLGDRIGATADTLEVLRFASEQTGSSWASVSRAVQDFTKNIAKAEEGAGEQANALEKIGLSAAGLKAMDLNGQMGAFADALQNAASESDKMMIAQAMFGRAGREMVNMLAGGSAGLNAFSKEAGDLGLLLGENRRDIEKANDAINRMKRAWGALINQVAVLVAPAITAISDAIAGVVAAFNKLFGLSRQKPPTFSGKAALTATRAELKEAETASKKAEAEAEKAMEAIKSRGEAVANGLRLPTEIFKDTMAELDELLRNGAIGWETYNRGAKKAAEELMKGRDALADWKTPSIGAVTRTSGDAFSAVQNAKREREDAERRHRESTTLLARIEAAVRASSITLAPVHL